jgi:septum formation topological specificity factor MinE
MYVQKHIDIAKDRPVHFQLNSEGQVSLFEMTVELEAGNRAPGGQEVA